MKIYLSFNISFIYLFEFLKRNIFKIDILHFDRTLGKEIIESASGYVLSLNI